VRKSFVVIGALLMSALVASATQPPPSTYGTFETFLGYNFVRFNPNSDFVPKANFNGGSAQFVYNFNKWLGAVADLGAVHKGIWGGYDVDTTVANYVFGPRVTFRNDSRFTPYFQALFGGAYGTTSAPIAFDRNHITQLPVIPPGFDVIPGDLISTRIGASQNAFAMMIGGGLDVKIGKHAAFRPLAFDYYLTRFDTIRLGTTNQNNWRYSAGFNFSFGAR